jgi:hypothetical protein
MGGEFDNDSATLYCNEITSLLLLPTICKQHFAMCTYYTINTLKI